MAPLSGVIFVLAGTDLRSGKEAPSQSGGRWLIWTEVIEGRATAAAGRRAPQMPEATNIKTVMAK